jgi:hypothetical protein
MTTGLVNQMTFVDVAETKRILSRIDTKRFYILISRRTAAAFFTHPLCECREDDMPALRRLMLPLMGESTVRQSSILVNCPPIPQHDNPNRLSVATFWTDGIWRKAGNISVHFRCLLATGSPSGEQEYTVVVRSVDIEEPGGEQAPSE